MNYIDTSLDDISRKHPNALVVLAGDLNTLPEQDIVARSTLIPIVDQPTQGLGKLNRIYTSEPSFDEIKVVASAVKSDHEAIVAYTGVKRTAPAVGYKSVGLLTHLLHEYRYTVPTAGETDLCYYEPNLSK